MTQRKPTPRRASSTRTPRAGRQRGTSVRGGLDSFAPRTQRSSRTTFNPTARPARPTRTPRSRTPKPSFGSMGADHLKRVRNAGAPMVGSALGSMGKAGRRAGKATKESLHTASKTLVGAFSGATDKAASSVRDFTQKAGPKVRTVNTALDSQVNIPMPEGKNVLLTRRQLLFGALGLGAVAAVGGAVSAATESSGSSDEVEYLEVPVDAVTTLAGCKAMKKVPLSLAGEFTLPYGTLVWANSDSYAACLLPTDTATPLTQVGILFLGSGEYSVVLEGPVSEGTGFDIYDVRCNDNGIIWTEANCWTGKWRIYQATHSGGSIGKPVLVDKGGKLYDVPFIAVAGNRAFWQVMPNPNGDASTEDSLLKSVEFGGSEPRIDWTSTGRMSTPPYSTGNGLVITPRVDTEGVYHQLTFIDAQTAEVQDTMTLPASMKPLEAGYVNGRFTFSFDAIYSYGDGIANLGTYVPFDKGGKSGAQWFQFDRNPSAPPCWMGPYFIVKSSRSVAGVDLATKKLFSLEVPDGCDDYGDYLASTGTVDSIVTYLSMPESEITEAYTLVRVWTA